MSNSTKQMLANLSLEENSGKSNMMSAQPISGNNKVLEEAAQTTSMSEILAKCLTRKDKNALSL